MQSVPTHQHSPTTNSPATRSQQGSASEQPAPTAPATARTLKASQQYALTQRATFTDPQRTSSASSADYAAEPLRGSPQMAVITLLRSHYRTVSLLVALDSHQRAATLTLQSHHRQTPTGSTTSTWLV